jgi:hypothetical protein
VKANIPIAITAVVVIVALAAAIFTAPMLESQDVKTDHEVEALVEQAQQRLHSYDPSGTRTLMTLQATEPASEQWSDAQQALNDPQQPISKSLREQERRLQQIADEYGHLVDPPQRGMRGSAEQAFGTMQAELQKNQALIREALDMTQKAVVMSSQSGQTHPEAARLQAILIHTQADVLRRHAGLLREAAQNQRLRFMKAHDKWQRTHAQLEGIEAELNGNALVPVVADAEPSTDIEEPATEPGAPRTGKPGILSQTLRKLFGGPSDMPEPPAEAVEPDVATSDEPEEEAPPAKAIPDAPPIDDRIAALEDQKVRVSEAIDETQKDVDRLQAIVDDLEQRLADALKRSNTAQKKMLELEQKGTDATDPQSLPTFVKEYEQASKEYREASMEANTLKNGALRHARIDTEDEAELLTAPLVPNKPGQELESQRGLLAMQHELRTAQGVLAKRQILAKEIETQLTALDERKSEIEQRVAKLSERREEEAGVALNELKKAVASLLLAGDKEDEALTLLENRGANAVQQAERAIQARVRDAQSQQSDDPTNERLALMTQEGKLKPYVALLNGDMKYVAASIYAQRAEDLRRHAGFLQSVGAMDIDARRALVPEDRPAENVPDSVWQADAAEAAAAEAYENAVQAGKEAIKVYEDSGQLSDLWVVRANIAAVSYMLAEFIEDPTAAQAYRDQAYREYERSIRDRPDSEAAKTYKPIMDKLTQAE